MKPTAKPTNQIFDPKKNTLEKVNESGRVSAYDLLLNRMFGDKSEAINGAEHGPRFAPKRRLEFTIFSHRLYRESDLIPREISQLQSEIKREVERIKQANKAFLNQVAEIEKAAIQTSVEKGGVYQVRFLEFMLSLLKNLRAKVTEAKTWLAAMQTKKKKRGSLFAILAKKKGTQYSLSQELQNTRSIQ